MSLYNKMEASEKSIPNTPSTVINSPGFSGSMKPTVNMATINHDFCLKDQEMPSQSNESQHAHYYNNNSNNSNMESLNSWTNIQSSFDKLNLLNGNGQELINYLIIYIFNTNNKIII